jgi:hypothetical protein
MKIMTTTLALIGMLGFAVGAQAQAKCERPDLPALMAQAERAVKTELIRQGHTVRKVKIDYKVKNKAAKMTQFDFGTPSVSYDPAVPRGSFKVTLPNLAAVLENPADSCTLKVYMRIHTAVTLHDTTGRAFVAWGINGQVIDIKGVPSARRAN